jgi:hypothetical protein
MYFTIGFIAINLKFILVNQDFISVNPCSINEQEFPEPESYQHEAKSKANS